MLYVSVVLTWFGKTPNVFLRPLNVAALSLHATNIFRSAIFRSYHE
jgi:hypothetical protein